MKRVKYAYRKTILSRYKRAKGCTDCGLHVPEEVLQFDHLRDKKFNISEGFGGNWAVVKKEIFKCEVVCANCHILRTNARRNGKR